eukprot:9478132-Pyramimonas_sp.AAC.1
MALEWAFVTDVGPGAALPPDTAWRKLSARQSNRVAAGQDGETHSEMEKNCATDRHPAKTALVGWSFLRRKQEDGVDFNSRSERNIRTASTVASAAGPSSRRSARV